MALSAAALPTVRYGECALADVMPSALAALGVPAEPNTLGLAEVPRIVVLLVDGLGWVLLMRNRSAAPFLTSLSGRALTAGFPTTTVTSLASLGTGRPPGQHGLTGYSSYLPDIGTTISWLAWRALGGGESLIDLVVPETAQPEATAFQRARAAGVTATVVAPAEFGGSGLTRAALRGGHFRGAVSGGDLISQVAHATRCGDRSLVYCYVSEMDLIGHVRGPESPAWLAQLSLTDRFVEQLSGALPADASLLVTADHGMTSVPDEDKIDFDDSPTLQDGVLALAGEPRARYVHARAGASDDVLATWREQLSDRMWVLSRDEAMAAGLFGPTVSAAASERIGDAVVISHSTTAVVRRQAESRLSALPGQHGALNDDDLLVPLFRA
ncbi:MAG: alkaline phosphatase family protein [Pseudonocardiales bacterium]|nr:MAG: alkaline phosphatase family protein [Pseudonocardiales bacterium]